MPLKWSNSKRVYYCRPGGRMVRGICHSADGMAYSMTMQVFYATHVFWRLHNAVAPYPTPVAMGAQVETTPLPLKMEE